MTLRSRKAHGVEVRGMTIGKPGQRDLVDHTLRHFLNVQEQWEKLPPSDARNPQEFLDQFAKEGWRLTGFREGGIAQDLRWWEPLRRALLQDAHDLGYYPRYYELIVRAGSWTSAGSLWAPGQEERRYIASVDGYRVVGHLDGQGTRFQVITAFLSVVISDGERRPGSFTFKELLRGNCPTLPTAVSRKPTGAGRRGSMRGQMQRARLLGEELQRAMESLAQEMTPRSALVFLDRLARCEAYSAQAQARAGIGELVARAQRARELESVLLAELAERMNLEGLRDLGLRVAGGDAEAFDSWVWDVLLVANVASWLRPDARARATALVEEAISLVEGNPQCFKAAWRIAQELKRFEPEWAGSERMDGLLSAFTQARELTALDQQTPEQPSPWALEALRHVLEQGPRQAAKRGKDRERWMDILKQADAALREARGRNADIIRLFERARGSGSRAGRGHVVLAADTRAGTDEVILRKVPSGRFILAHERGVLWLQWEGQQVPRVLLQREGTLRALQRDPKKDGTWWRLPRLPLGHVPGLVAEIGADKVELLSEEKPGR